jgi:hypothetical protein
MGTAAAAVLIGGSLLVANVGPGGSHRTNADIVTPPATTFATPTSPAPSNGNASAAPPLAESKLVVSRFISHVNARNVAGATSLVCPALQSSYAWGFIDLTYAVTLSRATQQLPRTATFRMIEQSGRSVVCGLVVE